MTLPVRRDPRRERMRERAAALGAPPPAPPAATDFFEQVEITAGCVIVVPDARGGRLSGHDRDAIAAGSRLARRASVALVALAPPGPEDYGALGIDGLVEIDPGTAFRPKYILAVLDAAIDAFSPGQIVLPDTVASGGHVGRMLASRRGWTIATNVVRLTGSGLLRHAQGSAVEQTIATARIILVAAEAADPVIGAAHGTLPITVATAPAPEPITDCGLLPLEPDSVPLAEADFIVSAGTGVTDWPGFSRLAHALPAAIGGTRAVCDAGKLPRARQVGASGTLVDPRCYLSFGISGAPQHLQGIARCECVIAVNTDLHAEMIKRAHLSIIADAQAVMPALIALVEGPR